MGRFADLKGKTAIVTGGSVGIGGAISRAFAENGVDVVVVGKQHRAAAEGLAEELAGLGTRSFALLADVAVPSEVDRLVGEATKRLGRVDILVNCAGGRSGRFTTTTMTPEEWDALLALNLTSCYLCSRAVLPQMMERRWGRIINISSVAARAPVPPQNPAYSAAKAGMIGFTKHLALEVAEYGITVNATTPGATMTPRAERNLAIIPGLLEFRQKQIPLHRYATPEEQAGIVVFLASEEASYITGSTFEVAGGKHMA